MGTMPRWRWSSRCGLGRAGLVAALMVLAGCVTMPPDALKLPPDSLAKRQFQTRRFDGIAEHDLLAACAGVLQDLGFGIDESETKLGVIVASKQRSAVETGQVIASLVVALLTKSNMSYDETQRIRVCTVTRPASDQDDRAWYVRVTFQRMVWNTEKRVSRLEAVDSPEIYHEFFEKLSKSVFLEAQKI